MPSQKGWKMSQKGRENISKALKGRTLSEAHKKHISRGLILHWAKRKEEAEMKEK